MNELMNDKGGHRAARAAKKQNDYNFKWENSTVLADGRNAIAITRQMNSDGAWGELVKLLRPPVIQRLLSLVIRLAAKALFSDIVANNFEE